ncbi:serpin family protein [Endozoicomonas sp. ALB091]|uniref:serpin family protein n=1 Tax=Endozoicomonas sp. ALB091 TaxID=3403073 RepID=UPI003BB65D68
MFNSVGLPPIPTVPTRASIETTTCNQQEHQDRAKKIVSACIRDLAFEILKPAGQSSTALSDSSLAASLGMLLATMDNNDKEMILDIPQGELTPQLDSAIHNELGRFSRKHPFRKDQMLSILNFMASVYNPGHEKGFVDNLSEHYKAELLTSDGNKNIADVTDQYVEQVTGGEIPGLLANHPLRDSIDTTINNVVSLKAKWAHAFNASNTKSRPFRCAGGSTINVKMMSIKDQIGYSDERSRKFEAIAKPFRQGENELYLVAIAPRQDSPDAIGSITKETIDYLIDKSINRTPREVKLTFPVMKINSTNSDLLDQIGSFRGIKITPDKLKKLGGPTPDSLSTKQTIVAKIDEEGARVSVATTTAITTRSVGSESNAIEFDFDSPGLVFIVDKQGNRVLAAAVKNGDFLVASGEAEISDGASSNSFSHKKKRKKFTDYCIRCGEEFHGMCFKGSEALKPKLIKHLKDLAVAKNKNPVKKDPSPSTQSFVTVPNLVGNITETSLQPVKTNKELPKNYFLPPKVEQSQYFDKLRKEEKESQLLMALQEKLNDIPIKEVIWNDIGIDIMVNDLEEAEKIKEKLIEIIGKEYQYCGGVHDFSNSGYKPRIYVDAMFKSRDILLNKLFPDYPKTPE